MKTESGRIHYHLSEPEISPGKFLLFQKILSLLEDSFNPDLFEKETDDGDNGVGGDGGGCGNVSGSGACGGGGNDGSGGDKGDGFALQKTIIRLLKTYSIRLSDDDFDILNYYILRDFQGFGKVQPFLEDSNIEDISCSGGNLPIYVFHRHYGSIQTNIVLSADETNGLVRKMAQRSGRQISVAEPMADAVLPDGSRAQLTLGSEITTKGSTFTIRRFNETPFTPFELIQNGTFTAEMMAYLWLCVESNMNMMFAGGTACGKTTSLNAVCRFIPIDKKIVSIEDTREINLPHLNWISGVSREKQKSSEEKAVGEITLYDLLKASLRQRPEYILVGEIRGSEAYVLFQAMSTGHTTISTMHAESVDTLIHRLENPPMNVPRVMIQTLDVLVILAQTEDEGRFSKKCLSIYEILETDPQTSEILTQEIFNLNRPNEKINLEKSAVLEKTGIRRGWTFEKLKDEFNRRVSELQSQTSGETK
ncbi:type II/IV secretion system ATPase subunit [Methanimicrococcus blatticola]|uniref:type II/IV secretion system ATPase subunit n=1 Tax=Methanimicrococcus blatticola TaxID=91560 RepID=UPI00105E60D8|nr:type II/IV secretion system ATPase subunit [Methanimicrococcus blatticola]MBZ3934907.1 type II/IV secretion system ATPase subunit [Methanimicrococcus blatticola]